MLETLTVEGQVCKVVKLWRTLDEADQVIYADCIRDAEKWSAIRLEREFRQRGLRISNDTILAHRAGSCACEERPF